MEFSITTLSLSQLFVCSYVTRSLCDNLEIILDQVLTKNLISKRNIFNYVS